MNEMNLVEFKKQDREAATKIAASLKEDEEKKKKEKNAADKAKTDFLRNDREAAKSNRTNSRECRKS